MEFQLDLPWHYGIANSLAHDLPPDCLTTGPTIRNESGTDQDLPDQGSGVLTSISDLLEFGVNHAVVMRAAGASASVTVGRVTGIGLGPRH